MLQLHREHERQVDRLRTPALLQQIDQFGDFYLQIKWDFHTWIPLASRLLPNDVCRIYKRGTCIRLDSTLVDFSDMKWQRGNISYLFECDAAGEATITSIKHDEKTFQRVTKDAVDEYIEDEIDMIMSSDIGTASMPTKHIGFTRAKSGVWGWRKERTDTVGSFSARVYNVSGTNLIMRKRREHLSEEDVRTNREFLRQLRQGTPGHQQHPDDSDSDADDGDRGGDDDNNSGSESAPEFPASSSVHSPISAPADQGGVGLAALLPAPTSSSIATPDLLNSSSLSTLEVDSSAATTASLANNTGSIVMSGDSHAAGDDDEVEHRPSLPPPPANPITWAEYMAMPLDGAQPQLGRAVVLKSSVKSFKPVVWMCDEFPLSVDTVIKLLTVLAPAHKHLTKLKQFVATKLPTGFPIKLEMPVFPTVTAQVTFLEYSGQTQPEELFKVPEGFTETPADQPRGTPTASE
ncbi:ankyrin repeat containing protein, variant 2 [Capsaspora owczarzaki ATCC 30864]|nr:ankyrin repeat containing protein, variant 2 [Capsaspora owczarzaki ATCC 30864]